MKDIGDIIHLLTSLDPEERRHAVRELRGDTSEEAVDLLLRALGDDDWRVRKEATGVAIAMAPAGSVLRRLVEALGPDQENVGLRNAAVEALASFGVASVDALSIALPALDADGRKLAAEALGKTGHTAALLVLAAMVADPDANVRAAVVEAVAGIGSTCVDDVTPLLERFLGDRDPLLRLTALNGLNDLGILIPWARLECMLDEPVLRGAALIAAGRSGDPAAGRSIAAALGRSRGSLSLAALSAMVALIRCGPESLATAREALQFLPEEVSQRLLEKADGVDDSLEERKLALIVVAAAALPGAAKVASRALADDRIAAEAEEALSLLGPDGVAALVEVVNVGRYSERALAIDALSRLADPVSENKIAGAIRVALDDPSPQVVASALEALAILGDDVSLEPAAELLHSENARIRRAAAAALDAMAPKHTAAATHFARSAHPDGTNAQAAAVVIGALGSPVLGSVEEDVAFLARVLAQGDAPARRSAVEALSSLVSAQAVEAVAFALTDEAPEVRRTAVRALGKMRTPDGSVPGLCHLLALTERSDDPTLTIDAVHALGDANDARAHEVLLSLVHKGSPRMALAAVEALGNLATPQRVSGLMLGLSHSDPEVVKAALQRLATEPSPQVGHYLGSCLEHQARDVRRLAADLLGKAGGEAALGALRQRLRVEEEPLVRDALQRALLEIELGSTALKHTTPPPHRGSTRPR